LGAFVVRQMLEHRATRLLLLLWGGVTEEFDHLRGPAPPPIEE
jgi:hypothetical protein